MNFLITEQMVKELNEVFAKKGSLIRFSFSDGKVYAELLQDEFISNPILNLTDKYKEAIENFFKEKGFKEGVSFNNTRSTFWILG